MGHFAVLVIVVVGGFWTPQRGNGQSSVHPSVDLPARVSPLVHRSTPRSRSERDGSAEDREMQELKQHFEELKAKLR